jgi:glucose/arabinose dehydrogenase
MSSRSYKTPVSRRFASLAAALLAAILATSVLLPRALADELAPGEPHDFFDLSTFASGFVLPTASEFLPDGRLVITEKGGRVLVRRPSGEIVEAGKLAVDDKTEKGLLNVIRSPNFETTHELVFYYSAANAPELDKHKIALIPLGNDDKLDLSKEKVIVQGLRGPDDHEMGGGLAIDKTGHLLVGVGDTGCRAHKLPEPPYTPTNYFATCLTNGNGKILRVNLDGSIPEDNPLVHVDQVTACGEKCGDDPFVLLPGVPRRDIWVWGVRNPWRLWVDPKTGRVWMGDVGDIANEEIDVIPPEGGLHYGWPFREGAAGHPVMECGRTIPARGTCTEPAYYCRHDTAPGTADAGCKSINGGLIVDDCRWPDNYRGRYFFGDNANGRMWTLTPTPARDGVVPGSRQDFAQADGFVVDFDMGPDGGLYVTVMRIPPEPSKVLRIAPRLPRTCEAEEVAPPRPVRRVAVAPPAPTVKPAKPRSRRLVLLGVLAFGFLVAAALVAIETRNS